MASHGRRRPADSALFTDLYELSMAQAYVADGLTDTATFECFFRSLGPERGYILAAGLETVLAACEDFAFRQDELDYLAATGEFTEAFLHWLSGVRFDGAIEAIPEGSVVFPLEPLLRLTAPLPVAQLLETRVLNALHYESLIASKAARIVDAAEGRAVLDFGARRAHGADAAVAAARSAWIAGCSGTSNMVAGQYYDLPVVGTMAHSYIQAWASELDAFRAFVRHYPATTLLVDTYDTLEGVDNVIRLKQELGEDFQVRAVRLDSGDLGDLATRARERLDRAGLADVRVVVSGGLDEHRIADLVAREAPIAGFGVGTDLVVSRDAPSFEAAYKLVRYADAPRIKTSSQKTSLPDTKQVFRCWDGDTMAGDCIAGADETQPGEALLQPVMAGGRRLQAPADLGTLRERASRQRAGLPAHLRTPVPGNPPYSVAVSAALRARATRLQSGHSA